MLTNQGTFYHPQVKNAMECQTKCKSIWECKFWDYGEQTCRLRSESGNGPQPDVSYTSGAKNCIYENSKGTMNV